MPSLVIISLSCGAIPGVFDAREYYLFSLTLYAFFAERAADESWPFVCMSWHRTWRAIPRWRSGQWSSPRHMQARVHEKERKRASVELFPIAAFSCWRSHIYICANLLHSIPMEWKRPNDSVNEVKGNGTIASTMTMSSAGDKYL